MVKWNFLLYRTRLTYWRVGKYRILMEGSRLSDDDVVFDICMHENYD